MAHNYNKISLPSIFHAQNRSKVTHCALTALSPPVYYLPGSSDFFEVKRLLELYVIYYIKTPLYGSPLECLAIIFA